MPILGLAPRLREIGRLRAGAQVVMADGRKRPSSLEVWRVTSAERSPVEAVALAFGGRVEPWTSPAGPAFQVTTEVDRLPVILPPVGAFSQAMELWASGGRVRACDGQAMTPTGEPCQCPSDPAQRAKAGLACSPVSRLSVLMPDVPGIGVWVLTSRGWAVAAEMGGMVAILEGRMTPAQLRLERREKRVIGQPTKQFTVPVLEVPELRIADLLGAGAVMGQLGPPAAGHLGGAARIPLALPAPTRAVDASETLILCGDIAGGILAGETCFLAAGHSGSHRSEAESIWPARPVAASA